MANCILIADDNDIVRSIIRFFLETEGFEVCGEATDGVDAIEKGVSELVECVQGLLN